MNQEIPLHSEYQGNSMAKSHQFIFEEMLGILKNRVATCSSKEMPSDFVAGSACVPVEKMPLKRRKGGLFDV